MDDSRFLAHYGDLVGLVVPWRVSSVVLDQDCNEVRVTVVFDGDLCCSSCGEIGTSYGTRHRRWRHLDTMEFQTFIEADIPRVKCRVHGVTQVEVPWAEDMTRFTTKFESVVIDWLLEASISAVCRRLGLSWDQAAGIQQRAVERGLNRRAELAPTGIGVDETSFKKRHDYITVVNDLDKGTVLWVGNDRKKETVNEFYESLPDGVIESVDRVAMDMWPAFISATKTHVPDAENKIVFDKFHVAQYLNKAVDQIRRKENKSLTAEGDTRLNKTRFVWLTSPQNRSEKQNQQFNQLKNSGLKVARGWAIKQLAMSLFGYKKRGWAERMWNKWYSWAIRSRLEPIKKVALMIKKHWYGIINAATSPTTNAAAESINSRIQTIKKLGCGYRNKQRFKNAIYFHLGGLNLHP